LPGNWLTITPEYGIKNIMILFSNLMDALPLPALISLEANNPLADRRDKRSITRRSSTSLVSGSAT